MAPERNPTETSPLLGEQSNALPPSTGAIPRVQGEEGVRSEQQTGGDEDPQVKHVALRYIVPAVSIGVCVFSFLRKCADPMLDLPICSRPNYHYG